MSLIKFSMVFLFLGYSIVGSAFGPEWLQEQIRRGMGPLGGSATTERRVSIRTISKDDEAIIRDIISNFKPSISFEEYKKKLENFDASWGTLVDKKIELFSYQAALVEGLELTPSAKSNYLTQVILLPVGAIKQIFELYNVFPEHFLLEAKSNRAAFLSNLAKLKIPPFNLEICQQAFKALKEENFFSNLTFSVLDIETIILNANTKGMKKMGIMAHAKAVFRLREFDLSIQNAFDIQVAFLSNREALEKIANLPLLPTAINEAINQKYSTRKQKVEILNKYLTLQSDAVKLAAMFAALDTINCPILFFSMLTKLDGLLLTDQQLQAIRLFVKHTPAQFDKLYAELPNLFEECVGKFPADIITVYERLADDEWKGLTGKGRIDAVIKALKGQEPPKNPVAKLVQDSASENLLQCISDDYIRGGIRETLQNINLSTEQMTAILPLFEDPSLFFDRRTPNFDDMKPLLFACAKASPTHVQNILRQAVGLIEGIYSSDQRIETIANNIKGVTPAPNSDVRE